MQRSVARRPVGAAPGSGARRAAIGAAMPRTGRPRPAAAMKQQRCAERDQLCTTAPLLRSSRTSACCAPPRPLLLLFAAAAVALGAVCTPCLRPPPRCACVLRSCR